MEEVEVVVKEKGASEVRQNDQPRAAQPQSLERPWVVSAVPEATFNSLLKWMFLIILSSSLLSNMRLGLHLRNDNILNSGSITAYLRWLLIPIVTDLKTYIILVIIAAVVGVVLRRLKKTVGSSPRREKEVSPSIQLV